MNLFDYINVAQRDFDVADTEYDASVTVCHIAEDKCSYDKFCNEIIKKVEVVKQVSDIILVANWTDLIKRNLEKFKMFSRKHWAYDYEDDEDEFIYQWIEEIHAYMGGYVSEDFYDTLVEFVDTLE